MPQAKPLLVKKSTTQHEWDKRFLKVAALMATWSKDPSTQVGCVIVDADRLIVSTGYNGFARGIDDSPDRYSDREFKYPNIVHAELNALLCAPHRPLGCTLYCTWPPCSGCAAAIRQAGITRVVWPRVEVPKRWQTDFANAQDRLIECGIDMCGVITVPSTPTQAWVDASHACVTTPVGKPVSKETYKKMDDARNQLLTALECKCAACLKVADQNPWC